MRQNLDVAKSDVELLLSATEDCTNAFELLRETCEEGITGCNQDYQDCLIGAEMLSNELDRTKIICGLIR